MRYAFQQFAATVSLSLFLTAVILVADATAQNVSVQTMKDASASFKDVFDKAKVNLDFENAKTTAPLGMVPVKEHWAKSLDEKGSAILGAIYARQPRTKIDLKPGFYTVQASKTNGSVRWILLKADGSQATKPLQVSVEKLPRDIGTPKALIGEKYDRCCFQDDSVMYCGECD